MVNRLILSVKTAALNHRKVKDVLTGGEWDQKGEGYPLVRIWPGRRYLNGQQSGSTDNRYEIIVAVSDRHQDNPTSEIEAISDSDQIIEDLLATVQYMYRDDLVSWYIQGDIEPFQDSTPDKVGGVVANFIAKVPYNADFCGVPSHDFDFPAVGLFALSIIDEGGPDAVYASNNIIDGGTP